MVVIPAYQTSVAITVQTPNNSASDGPLALQVNLESKSHKTAIVGVQSLSKLRIEDDDDPPTEALTTLSVTSSANHTCVITSTGALKYWGDNTNGQLGDGTTTTRPSPTEIDPGVAYQAISTGVRHTCGITSSGVLKCWGQNTFGQVGDGTFTPQASAIVIDPGVTYRSIHAGTYSTCGVTTAGELKCWGSNSNGELGLGSNSYLPLVLPFGFF